MTPKKTDNKKIYINMFIMLVISIVSICVISWIYQGASLSATIRAVRPLYLLMAVSLVVLNWIVESLRLKKIIEALGSRIGFKRILEIELMTCFFAKITPFESGGESFLLYFFHKDRNYPVGITTSIIMTKVLFSHFARLSMGILIPIFVVVFKSTWEISRGVSIALDVGLASYIFFFSLMSLIFFKPQKIKPVIRALSALPLIRRFNKLKIDEWVNKFNKIMDDFKEVRGKLLTTKRSDLVLVGIYSFLCWIFIFCVPVFLLKGMGIHSPIIHVLTIAIFYQIASAYAPTPGSSGVAEIGFASLFSILVPHSLLFVFVILWRGVTHYMVILVGAIFTIKEAIVQRRKLKSLPVRSA